MTLKHIAILFTSLIIMSSCRHQEKYPEIVQDEYYSGEAVAPIPNDDWNNPANTQDGASEARAPSAPKQPEVQGEVLIGLLVPLTGPQAEIGKQLRDAALLGLYDKQKSLTRMEMTQDPQLVIRDSGNSAEKLKKSMDELIEKKVSIILGPLMADEVREVAEAAKKASIPLVSFSNNEDVAKAGTYIFGFDPAEQIRRVAGYALKAQVKHFAALAPQSEYGRKVVQQLSTQISAQGLSLQPVEFFNEGFAPSPFALKKVADGIKEWGDQRKAVFLPMTGRPLLETASNILTTKNIGTPFLKFLGTGLWDDTEVIANPSLKGAWFATSDPRATVKFKDKFMSTYGYKPMRLASLAYDAVALATTLALEDGKASFTPSNITDPKGFYGPANGTFRLLANGRVERLLSVVEVGSSGFFIIDPAPTKF